MYKITCLVFLFIRKYEVREGVCVQTRPPSGPLLPFSWLAIIWPWVCVCTACLSVQTPLAYHMLTMITCVGHLNTIIHKCMLYNPYSFFGTIIIVVLFFFFFFLRRILCTIPPAFSYRLGQLSRFFGALQTSRVLHKSIVHAKAWTNC